jgi:hypothetical protein
MALVWATYALEGEVVGVATGKVEVLAIELENAILGSDESSRGLAGGLLGGGIGSSSQKAEGHGADGVEEHCVSSSILNEPEPADSKPSHCRRLMPLYVELSK